MARLTLRSSAEQVAAHLRGELRARVYQGSMPGVIRLEEDLGVNRKTVEAGLRLLENEGLLVGQGPGRRRLIESTGRGSAQKALRIGILNYERSDRRLDYILDLEHRLENAGHRLVFPEKTLVELGMKMSKIRRLVAANEADAWIVSAASREVLEWFSTQPVPVFARFGRMEGLGMAGTKPGKGPIFAAAVRELVALGHQRITLLTAESRRLPEPGRSERAFLQELESQGIRTGPYNLPDWELSIAGFHQVLQSLFQATPPTALFVDEAPLLIAAQQFLGNRGLRVPQDVSLICTDGDPSFKWCEPSITHFDWDSRPVVRRIVRWAKNVSEGKEDLRQTLTKAEFVKGGTIGPVVE